MRGNQFQPVLHAAVPRIAPELNLGRRDVAALNHNRPGAAVRDRQVPDLRAEFFHCDGKRSVHLHHFVCHGIRPREGRESLSLRRIQILQGENLSPIGNQTRSAPDRNGAALFDFNPDRIRPEPLNLCGRHPRHLFNRRPHRIEIREEVVAVQLLPERFFERPDVRKGRIPRHFNMVNIKVRLMNDVADAESGKHEKADEREKPGSPSHFSGCIGLSHDDPPLFLSQTAWSRRASDATWSTSSSYGIPTARAAIGTRECGVMPGFVLISRR